MAGHDRRLSTGNSGTGAWVTVAWWLAIHCSVESSQSAAYLMPLPGEMRTAAVESGNGWASPWMTSRMAGRAGSAPDERATTLPSLHMSLP